MPNFLRRHWILLLAVLIALVAVAVLAAPADDPPERPRTFEKVDPPGPTPPIVIDTDNEQQIDEAIEAHDAEPGVPNIAPGPAPPATPDIHEDARDETPPGIAEEELEAGAEKTEQLQDKEALKPERPAGAQAYRCVRRPVRNQSALSGVFASRGRQHGVAMHFTVSEPGSLFVIRGLFDTRPFGASSNYGWDWAAPRGEYCHVWVDVGKKAWAQGPANSAYVSIEIHTKDRSRASWIANLKDGRLAALVRDLLKQTGAPIRLVDPQGCVFPPGLTDHERLECGNTHWDVGRNFPWDYFLAQVRRGATPNPLTPAQQKACDTLNFHRRRAHIVGRWYGRDAQGRPTSRLKRALELKRQIPTGRCPSKYRR